MTGVSLFPRLWSFRAHVLALVLASVLPLAALGVYSMVEMSEGERVADRRDIISTARVVSSIIDERLEGYLRTLRAQAHRFPGLSGDLEDYYGDCATHAAESGGTMLLADTTGQQIFNSKLPLGSPLPHVVGTSEFWQVIAASEPRIGNMFTSSVDETPSFAVMVPVVENGRTIAVLVMSFPTQTLSDLLSRQRLPEEWTLGVVDRLGTIITRHNGGDAVGGMKASPDVIAMPPQQNEALFERPNREGIPSYLGVARSALTGWRVVVGIPVAVIEAPLHRSLWNFALLGGGVLLVTLGIGVMIGGRLAGSMKTLARAAHALARHEASPTVPTTVGEIESAATALRDAGNALARKETELRRSREHLLRAQRIGRIGSIEHDLKTGVMICSDEALRIFGVDRAEFITSEHNFYLLIHEDDRERVRASRIALAQGGRQEPLEYRIIPPDGVTRILYREAETIYDEAGQPASVFITVKDVTELRASEERRHDLERQLQHAQKVEALGTLAGGIAHDLNNTLVPILGLAKLTLRHLPEGSRDRANLATILEAGERGRDLVRRILAFSRKERPSRDVFDIVLVVRDALKIVRASLPSTILIAEAIEPVPQLMGDAGQLHQVIINLVVNAAHAIGDSMGTITVALRADEAPLQDVNGPPVPVIRLSVSDTGCGINASTLQRIFEPFFTTKPVGEGTGLGLSMVHGIVVQHGGRIAVESSVGHGTCFDIFLPPFGQQVVALATAAVE